MHTTLPCLLRVPHPPCWKVHGPTVLLCGGSLNSSHPITPPATIMALMSQVPLPCPSPSSLTPFSWMGVSNRNTYLHIHIYLHIINGTHVDLHTVHERIHTHTYKQVKIIHTHKLIRSLHTVHMYMCVCVRACVRVCVCVCYHPPCPKPPTCVSLSSFSSSSLSFTAWAATAEPTFDPTVTDCSGPQKRDT